MRNTAPKLSPVYWALTLVLTCAAISAAQSRSVARIPNQAEQRVARYFESLRKSPPQMLAFLLRMPKGGDLHNHLSGAIYAESYIQWAADKGLCVSEALMTLTSPPC